MIVSWSFSMMHTGGIRLMLGGWVVVHLLNDIFSKPRIIGPTPQITLSNTIRKCERATNMIEYSRSSVDVDVHKCQLTARISDIIC